jgi:hypothetical protein
MGTDLSVERLRIEDLHPLRGSIEADISENSKSRRALSMVQNIYIEFAPVHFADKQSQCELRLSSFDMPVRSWRDLEQREYEFSKEPMMGLADGVASFPIEPHASGALSLFEKQLAANATSISFGRINNGRIPVAISVHVKVAPVDGAPPIVGDNLLIETELEIGGVRIRGDVIKLRSPALEDAISIAERFLDLSEYEEPKAEQFVTFYPRN